MKTWLFLFVLLLPFASADSYHLKLLTVSSEDGKSPFGATADVYLEVLPGSGRIFMDSFPLTKLDTQVSTRFANEIACHSIDFDCSRKDFFYTIRADTSIVGGPSAGLGMAVLTVAALKDLDIDETISMTGTINSGGIVGPVGGIYQKVKAAQDSGLKKVLLPKWVEFNESGFANATNSNLSVEVVKISNLDEALFEVTSLPFDNEEKEIEISDKYFKRMEAVSDILCGRTRELSKKLGEPIRDNTTSRIEEAANASKFYSIASYCFMENVVLREKVLDKTVLGERLELVSSMTKALAKLNSIVDKQPLKTISDLETYMVVKERVVESSQALSTIDLSSVPSSNLAYIMERYFSAVAWSQFFGLGGKPFNLEENALEEVCVEKIAEAEERLNYVYTISPRVLSSTRIDLNFAYRDKSNGKHTLCIFKAIKAKADANTFLMALYTKQDSLSKMVSDKLAAAKNIILEQQERGVFPILGFSYYEYSDSLKGFDTYSSLLFSEYSLEMSNLELYFPPRKKFNLPVVDFRFVGLFLLGVLIGFFLGKALKVKNSKKKNRKKK